MSGNQQTLSTTLRQEQQLSARQLQSLELLNLPLLELEEKLTQALENNPLLEAECADPLPEPEPVSEAADEDESLLPAEAAESEEWNDELPLPPERTSSDEAEERREYLMNSLTDLPTLQDQLEFELAMTSLPEDVRRAAAEIIGGIDDSGYLRSTVADIVMSTGEPVETVEKALKVVQSFDPPGVGCRDLPECLRLQLERKHALTPVLKEILDHHLEFARRTQRRSGRTAKTLPLSRLGARAGTFGIHRARSRNRAP